MFMKQYTYRFHQRSVCHIHGECYKHCAVCCGYFSGLVLISKPVLNSFEYHPNYIDSLYISAEIPFAYGIYTEPRGFSSLLGQLLPLELTEPNETLGIKVQLKIMSQATNFMK
jgi:hypothetical protein